MKIHTAKLKTGNKTDEQLKADYDGDVTQKEIDRYREQMNVVDGLEVYLTNSSFADGFYVLLSWRDADDHKWREFFWLAEQDPMFGTHDDKDEFLKDWESGEYEPSGMVAFRDRDVEIVKTKELGVMK